MFGAAWFNVLFSRRYKLPLSVADPSNACGPVFPSTTDHIAVVPTCMSGQSSDCSLEEKAKHLGQANYAVFITWDAYSNCNCSSSEFLKGICVMRWCQSAMYCLVEHATCTNGLLMDHIMLKLQAGGFYTTVLYIYQQSSSPHLLVAHLLALAIYMCPIDASSGTRLNAQCN